MPVNKGLEWTFDTVSDAYDKFRPGYVDALYETIFQYIQLDESSHALEIGIGAGQATPPVLRTGCKITAVEYGEQFSALCREKFREYPGFSVINSRFEDVGFPAASIDFVYSASAFHWIPEEIGYRKVFDMLRPGGAFARFANHPYRGKNQPELSDEINRLYRKYYDAYHNRVSSAPTAYTDQQARDRALIAEKYGFTDIQHALFYRSRHFSASEYVSLLGTYSDHIAMEESVRKAFFSAIEDAINDHGGVMTLDDTIDLQLARKP